MEAIKPAPAKPERKMRVCNICGKESMSTICDACSARIRLEALARKRHEEEGNSWSHWE
jgi:recombinational DNA repair protein RecR